MHNRGVVESELPTESAEWGADERDRAQRVLAGETVVVNVRRGGPHRHLVPWLLDRDLLTYVGHAGRRHGWPESDFASPFVKQAATDRAGSIRNYEQWLTERTDLLARVADGELSGRALGCWCAPKPCHADMLARRSP